MSIVLAARSNTAIRLEEEGGAELTMDLSGDDAQILYMYVPTEQRRQGIGSALLATTEQVAVSEGKKQISCGYSAKADAFSALLEKNGYDISEGDDVVTVNTKDLIMSTGVKKSLRMKFKGVMADALDDMLVFQWEEVVDFLKYYHYDIDVDELSRFEQTLSYAVYDEAYKPRAVILVSAHGEELLIEFLFGISKANQQFVISACQEFIKALMEQDLVETYPRISMIAANNSVIPLLMRLMDKDYEVTHTDRILCGKKQISEKGEYPASGGRIKECGFWRRKSEKDAPYQCNINQKYQWAEHNKKGVS